MPFPEETDTFQLNETCLINIILVVLLFYPFMTKTWRFLLLNVLKPVTEVYCYLCLHILDAHNGFLIFQCGVIISALFEELVPLTMEHRYRFQPLLIIQSPGLSVILTGLLYLNPLLIIAVSFTHMINFQLEPQPKPILK